MKRKQFLIKKHHHKIENFLNNWVWIRDPDPVYLPGSGSGVEDIMNPDPVCPARLNPDPGTDSGQYQTRSETLLMALVKY